MIHQTRGVRHRKDGVTTIAPLWRHSTIDVLSHLAAAGIPLCPTYERMEQIGMPLEARRVGRIIGRRNMTERMMWLQRGWPSLHAEYTTRWQDLR